MRSTLVGGSIPAHTGKPDSFVRYDRQSHYGVYPRTHGETHVGHCPAPLFISLADPRVYPRTHGETWFFSCLPHRILGLSPHTRGNHSDQGSLTLPEGSIPAHTGKPRACPYAASSLNQGLSPHTRGNLYKRIPLAPYNWTGNLLAIFTTFSPAERHQHHGFPWVDRRDDGGRGHRMQCYHATS